MVGTQTATLDGTSVTQTWAPADGPSRTSSRLIGPPSSDMHLASGDEAVLGLGALGAMVGLPVAPAGAAAEGWFRRTRRKEEG